MIHPTAIIIGEVEIGEGTRIDAYAVVSGNVKIGKRVHIGVGVAIFGAYGVTLGDDSGVSAGVKIYTGTNDVDSPTTSNPQSEIRGVLSGPVVIGVHSMIGANSVVMPNTFIGDEVQVACLSMAKGTIPDNEVWGGVPAKYIKPRVKIR